MKLNKSYIKQLISEQLQEVRGLKSSVQKNAEAIQPEDLPGAVAGIQAGNAAGTAQSQILQGALVKIVELAPQLGEAGAPVAQIANDALKQAAKEAEEAVKSVQP